MKQYRSVVLIALLFNLGCGGTTTGNPVVTLKAAPYSSFAASWLPRWFPSLITPAYASVSSLTLCFKRLRFKTAYDGESNGDSTTSENFDFDPGEVTLSPSGSTLGQITLPAGTYRRIEFDLDDHCASSKSVQLTNTSGSISTRDGMTIKFEGTFLAEGEAQDLSLQFQNLVTALDSVTTGSNIKPSLEAVGIRGSF